MGKLPYDQLFVADVVAETARLSLAETGAYLKLRMACHSSSTRGVVEMSSVELARILGASAEQAGAVMSALSDGTNRIFVLEDAPNGRKIVRYPTMIESEKRRVIYAKNGRKGGRKTSSARSDLLKQTLKPSLQPSMVVELDSGVVTEEGVGETQGRDVLDREIRAYFDGSAALLWTRPEHAALRKIVTLAGWDRAKELVTMGLKKPASHPCAYALGILGNKQIEEARKPKFTPPGKFSTQSKRYCPG